MPVRPLTLVCVALLLTTPSACANPMGRRTAPPAPAASEPVSPPSPASTPAPTPPAATPPAPTTPAPSEPVLSGPRTVCGELQPPNDGPMAAIAVHTGRADCREVMRVFRAYYRPDTPKQGSAGVATVAGWLCASNSAAQAMTGRLSSCRKGRVRVVADAIP